MTDQFSGLCSRSRVGPVCVCLCVWTIYFRTYRIALFAWSYTSSRFARTPICDRRKDEHRATTYTALSWRRAVKIAVTEYNEDCSQKMLYMWHGASHALFTIVERIATMRVQNYAGSRIKSGSQSASQADTRSSVCVIRTFQLPQSVAQVCRR